MTEQVKKYLGIDWGEKRIGLSISDSRIKLAMPYKVVNSIDEILNIIKQENINIIIIGKPYWDKKIKNLNQSRNSDNKQKLIVKNKKYIEFVKLFSKKISVPLKFEDERLTSKAADKLEGGKRTKASRDEIAAMLILQGYLDKIELRI